MDIISTESVASPGELRTRREILEIFWRRGLSGQALLQEHSVLIDTHLAQNFQTCGAQDQEMALVALGGYGRAELFPFSDIDLLLLHTPAAKNDLSRVTEAIFYPLWDAGLEVGHGVRTVEACLADADEDFFFQVAMLDARFLAGSRSLFDELQAAYQKKYIEGRRRQFFEEMVFHRQERLRRYGKHSYQLEPQIKESRGGFRDVQALRWTAKVVFGLKDLEAIKEAGLFTVQEYDDLVKAWEHLIRIRNRLHYISGRKNDRLYFEHQEEIAKAFNYRNSQGLLAVEHFMREVYAHLATVAMTVDLFFEHVAEVVSQGGVTVAEKKLEPGLTARNDRIHIAKPAELSERPELLMRVFAQAARTGLPIHHRTRKLLSANLHLVDDEFRSNHSLGKAFWEILRNGKEILPLLETMVECGFLAAYIPEFGRLRALAQHEVYHVYTVDHHLIQCVAMAQELSRQQKSISQGFSAPHLLSLAALLHDIGKGSGKDHSEYGAELVLEVGQRLGLKGAECETLSFLVRHHLFLSDTAMHRDLEDESLIERCADLVEDHERLAMLYLLSMADAKATGPTVWTEWKGALLLDLYLKVGLHIDQAGRSPQDLREGLRWIREKVGALLEGEERRVDIETLPDDYLLGFTPEEIAAHVRSSATLGHKDLQVTPEVGKTCSLTIITRDRSGLLAKICGVIAIHNLKVLAAQIFTWPDGTAVDVIEVESLFEDGLQHQDWRLFNKDLELAVDHRLGIEHRLSKKGAGVTPSATRGGAGKVRVAFDNEGSEQFTIIEVHARDRVGLLYMVTRTLSYFMINIFRAKIGSRSDQVVDVFYVLDSENRKITDGALLREIEESLVHAASAA